MDNENNTKNTPLHHNKLLAVIASVLFIIIISTGVVFILLANGWTWHTFSFEKMVGIEESIVDEMEDVINIETQVLQKESENKFIGETNADLTPQMELPRHQLYFEEWGDPSEYYTDGLNVYYSSTLIEGADAASFVALSYIPAAGGNDAEWAKDKSNVYNFDRVQPNIDANTFVTVYKGVMKDKDRVYFYGDWTCPGLVPVTYLIQAASLSNASGLLPPSVECLRRGL